MARDLSKYVIEITDDASWQSVIELSDEKLVGMFFLLFSLFSLFFLSFLFFFFLSFLFDLFYY